MNKRMLSKNQYKRLRLYPMARRIDERYGIELEQIDDAWLVIGASRTALELRNPRSDQYVVLGTDHVREFMSDTGRADGILVLKSQVFLFARHMPQIVPLN